MGAAALHAHLSLVHPTNLESAAHHSVYKAELVGIRLASKEALLRRNCWLFIYNQASIRALASRLTKSPALALRKTARIALNRLLENSPGSSLTLVWFPDHVDIQENKTVDEAAKEASTIGALTALPLSLAAFFQQINTAFKLTVSQEPAMEGFKLLCGVHNSL